MDEQIPLKRTASYYLSDDLQLWIKRRAGEENRSESNYLETLLRRIKDTNTF